ncbi:hypothetical protein TWF751_005170 [Orbilia oligospora]|nr:hypothetical protein TWF751_005170 [Orbilia oligospora]
MTAIFVRDFGLAKISFTIPGTLKLQKAWAEFTGGDFVSGKDIDDLLDAINREFYKGAADYIEDQLYQTYNEDMDLEFLEQENSIKFTVHSGYY